MIKINILCVGKLKEVYLKEAEKEYIKRLSAFCKLMVVEVDEHKMLDNNPGRSKIENCINQEGIKLISRLPSNSYKVAMCVEGKKFSSEGLSEYISKLQIRGVSNICFIIGGSWGLSDDIKKITDLRLSFSDMTFPHQLTRIMLFEQIYRSFQIMNQGKYHK